MCGIVGYVGLRAAAPLLMDGLSRLEYRGYDSAGLALHLEQGGLGMRKSLGKLASLEKALARDPLSGISGIGHTRWATHGEPSLVNCHPHTNTAEEIAVVHNGIIENYQALKDELAATGHQFTSETDTEVIPHLIEEAANDGVTHFGSAVRQALSRTTGAYALGIIHQQEPGVIYAARLGSPLIIGIGDDETFIASDVPAILNQVKQVIYLEDGEMAEIRPGDIKVFKLDGTPVAVRPRDITIEAESADRGGFETFMLKEMHEQPRVLRGLIEKYVSHEGSIRIPELEDAADDLASLNRVLILSCGTAYYAGMFGRIMIEHYTTLPAETDLGSEFRYSGSKITPATLVIAVSQSGETADTLASIRLAKEKGCRVLSICNVPGSTLARESDFVLYTNAGLEIGVASTKAYTAQLMMFSLLTLYLAGTRSDLGPEKVQALLKELAGVPDAIHHLLSRKEHIRKVADKHHDGPSALYLGRRFNHPTALEGALKNKEISYQHAEGYAAGEMKHGPIALINEYMPVICICTQTEDEVYEKMISNMREVEARNGRIIAVATDGDKRVAEMAEDIIFVPPTREAFSPMINVVALQFLAYYSAQARGTDIDQPRNLAKSVTVE